MSVIRNNFFRLMALNDAIDLLRSRSAYSASAQWLWNLIKVSTNEMIKAVSELPVESVRASHLSNRYVECADYFHRLLGFIHASEAGLVPESMIIPIEEMIRKHVSKANIIVAYHWLPSNYSFKRQLPKLLKSQLTVIFESDQHEVVQSIPAVLAVLAFPAAEKENVLFHSILGHEVGHALSERFGSVKACKKFCLLEDEMYRLTKGESLDMFELNTLQRNSTKILAEWIDELISDAWSVWLMQPASLFAIHALDPLQSASDDHPPGYLRFNIMLECLRRMGFMDIAEEEEWLKNIFNKIESDGNQSKITQKDALHYQIPFATLENVLDKIVDHVMENATDAAEEEINPDDFAQKWLSEQHPLIERLLNYVPPDCLEGTIGDDLIPADLSSIINAGWSVYFGYWSQFCEGLSAGDLNAQYDARKKLNRLLLKAIELSSIVKQTKEGN